MANANIARGLIPVRYRNGAPYNGAANMYYVPSSYATALYIGSPVISVTDSADGNGIQAINHASAGGGAYILGSIIGFVSHGLVTRLATDPVYRPASTAAYALVADDPDLLFEMQEDSVGGVMTDGAAGRNADFIGTSGSTVSGYSASMIDSSTLNTNNTLQLRIIKAVERADNDITSSYAKWLVSINLHAMRNLTGI